MNTVRNYSDEIKQIIETYKSMYENQTLDWVKQQHQHYDNFPNINSNRDIIHKLDNIKTKATLIPIYHKFITLFKH